MYLPFFLPNYYLLNRQISQQIGTFTKVTYKCVFLLVFVLAVVVSAVPVQVGIVYEDVIEELGRPDGKMVIGNKQVLTYGDAKVAIRGKNVISVSPEFHRLLKERADKLKRIQTMREANLVNFRGQWITEKEKEQIIRAEEIENNSNIIMQDYDSIWLTDFVEASALAKSQSKKILLNFTGSDWCAWSIKLDEDIFSKPEFMQKAQQEYVLVKLDFPKRKKLDPTIKEQNKALAERFKIGNFPSVVVLTPSGNLHSASTGIHIKDNPEAFLSSIL